MNSTATVEMASSNVLAYDAFCDFWLESVIIAISLCAFLRMTAPRKRRGCADNFGGKKGSVQGSRVGSALQVRIQDLQDIDKYEQLAHQPGVNLADILGDETSARFFYLRLFESACVGQTTQDESMSWSQMTAKARANTSMLFADMRKFGIEKNQAFYSSLLRMLAGSKLFEEVMALHEMMVSEGVQPDHRMYLYLLTIAVTLGLDDKAVAFFTEVCKLGNAPLQGCKAVLRVHANSGDWRAGVEAVHMLARSGTQPDAWVMNMVLGLCIKMNQFDILEPLMARYSDAMDTISYNLVLKCCVQKSNPRLAEKLFAEMLSKGVPPSVITFNSVMAAAMKSALSKALSKAKQAEEDTEVSALISRVWQLLDMMEKHKVEPDLQTIAALVRSFRFASRTPSDGVDRCIAIFQRSTRESLIRSCVGGCAVEASLTTTFEVVFNTLLDTCANTRDLEGMSRIMDLMRVYQVIPSTVSHSILIKGFGALGLLERCHLTWKSYCESRQTPTVELYGCYIDACLRNKDLQTAERTFRQMTKEGIRPNVIVYTSMIRGYGLAEQLDRAHALYTEMLEEGIAPTVITIFTVFDVLRRMPNCTSALDSLLDDMHKFNLGNETTTSIRMVKTVCTSGSAELGMFIFRKFRALGLPLEKTVHNVLLTRVAKTGQVEYAEEIAEDMRVHGMPPTQAMASSLMKVYTVAKMFDKALNLGNEMQKEHGLTSNLQILTCSIQALVRSKQIRKSWAAFGDLVHAGHLPDGILYGALIYGCVSLNMCEQSMEFVRFAYKVRGHKSATALLRCLEVPSDLSNLQEAELSRRAVVKLQPCVLKALESLLRRKCRWNLLEELQAIMQREGVSRALDADEWQGDF